MCQRVNLFWKKAVSNVGCVSANFLVDTKILYGYNFVAYLSIDKGDSCINITIWNMYPERFCNLQQ